MITNKIIRNRHTWHPFTPPQQNKNCIKNLDYQNKSDHPTPNPTYSKKILLEKNSKICTHRMNFVIYIQSQRYIQEFFWASYINKNGNLSWCNSTLLFKQKIELYQTNRKKIWNRKTFLTKNWKATYITNSNPINL